MWFCRKSFSKHILFSKLNGKFYHILLHWRFFLEFHVLKFELKLEPGDLFSREAVLPLIWAELVVNSVAALLEVSSSRYRSKSSCFSSLLKLLQVYSIVEAYLKVLRAPADVLYINLYFVYSNILACWKQDSICMSSEILVAFCCDCFTILPLWLTTWHWLLQ